MSGRPSTLVLVRHGESTWIAEGRFQGQGDPPLSSVGAQQAAAVAARLADPARPPALPVPGYPPTAIWHSPLERAAQTAFAIRDALGAETPTVALTALMELAQGEWEGQPHAEVRRRWPTELAAWRRDPARHHAPGGEPLAEAFDRARTARARILESGGPGEAAGGGEPPELDGQAPPEPVLGYERAYGEDEGPAWALVVAHDGILRLLLLDLLGLGLEHFWSFPLALAAVSVLDLETGVVRLRAHNLPAS